MLHLCIDNSICDLQLEECSETFEGEVLTIDKNQITVRVKGMAILMEFAIVNGSLTKQKTSNTGLRCKMQPSKWHRSYNLNEY